MVTMKDVARLAGVSHGTVSNVLNGTKNVSLDKIKRVENAIIQLGYNPNEFARNLKKTKTGRHIYVVLPSMEDYSVRNLYDSIARNAEVKGYRISLFITNDQPHEEKQILSNAQMLKVDGVILMTCQPKKSDYFKKLKKSGLNLLFILRSVAGFDFVGIDIKEKLIKSIEKEIAQGAKRIAMITGPKEYSYESQYLEAYFYALFNADIAIKNEYIRVTNLTKESALSIAITLLNEEKLPDTIYLTSEIIAQGVRKAIDLTVMPWERKPKLVIAKSPLWTDYKTEEDDFVLHFEELAERAFGLITKRIESNHNETESILITEAIGNANANIIYKNHHHNDKKLNILLHECQVGYAMKTLAKDFHKKTGIEVNIDLVKYEDVLDIIKQDKLERHYDVYSIDVTWTKELAEEKHIENLEPYIKDKKELIRDFQKNIFQEYCIYDNHIYSLPYRFTAQMMYYRKDLFEKVKNKRLYSDMYNEDLKVPTTWAEYNQVAKFFTRRFNPESETEYGTTLGARHYSGAICEFLPRLWAFGGVLFDNDHVRINSQSSIDALKNYVESFDYAPSESVDWWWDEEVHEFCSGTTAMMVLYSDHTAPLRDRNVSKVVGTTGFGFIPGAISCLGGWTICLSAASLQKDLAFEFIEWTIAQDMAMPNAVLGRVLPYRMLCENTELSNLYPWHKQSFKVLQHVGKRVLPLSKEGKIVSEIEFEDLVSKSVRKAIKGEISPEDAIALMEQQLTKLLG